MPGFSKMEQARLSLLALTHRGSLSKAREFVSEPSALALLLALRLAVLFHRSRSEIELPRMEAHLGSVGMARCELHIEHGWLERNPLTDTVLHAEVEEWATLGFDLRIEEAGSKAEKTVKGTGL